MSVYQAVNSRPIKFLDTYGLRADVGGGGTRVLPWNNPPPMLPPGCHIWGCTPGPWILPPPRPPQMDPPGEVVTWRDCPDLANNCKYGVKPKPGPPSPPNACGADTLTNWGLHLGFLPYTWDFASCCNNHDLCYGACGANRSDCDDGLFSCQISTCRALYGNWFGIFTLTHERCIQAADMFRNFGVRPHGQKPFCAAQVKSCVCK